MNAQKVIKSLCCTYGWSYGIFWGFHHTNSILLTFKESYCEQPMQGLIDGMLLQTHVLGGGVIGEAALMKYHRWVYSDEGTDSFEVFQDDSEFYQFSMGIKTIVVIPVEPWGVLELGSTDKVPEVKGFVDQVKQLSREMYQNEAYSDSQFFHQNPLLPPDYQSRNFISPIDNLIQIQSNNIFDSELTSSWPHLTPGLDETTQPMDHGSCGNSSLDEFFHGSSFCFSTQGLEDGFSHCLSPHGLIDNLPTYSLQSSVSDALLEECISIGSTSKSLFSELGLDQLLDGVASTSHSPLARSGFEDRCESRTKRRRTENFSWSNKSLDSKEFSKASNPCIGGRSRAEEEEAKGNKKKKGKGGSRKRPKDRQMIQDRLAELRDLIPNGYKLSIDRLLEGTIRHLNFMQSLTKHAQSLKQIDEQNVKAERGGVTWACEVGDKDMVCQLLVEDFSTSGQMLIEMVCEEQGSFLEIVDAIRGLGLIIRKGVMEVSERSRIRGEFVVEAEVNRRVSRHEIFASLIQLLQLNSAAASLPRALQCANQ